MNWDKPVAFEEFDHTVIPLNRRHGVSWEGIEWNKKLHYAPEVEGKKTEIYKAYLDILRAYEHPPNESAHLSESSGIFCKMHCIVH